MNEFMKIAIDEARSGIISSHGGPFGAVIVKDGKIIAAGHNHVLKNNDPTCHGEVDAIRKACKKLDTFDLSGCDIYTTGEPCPMCLGAILWSNINHVYYGCTIEDNEKIGFRDTIFSKMLGQTRTSALDTFMTQVDRKECLDVFDDYTKLNHQNY